MRYLYWKPQLKHLGKKVRIDVGVSFQGAKHICISDNCWIDRNVIIMAGYNKDDKRSTFFKENPNFKHEIGEVFIDKEVHIAPNCVLNGIGGIHVGRCSSIAANSTIFSFSAHYMDLNCKTEKLQYAFTPLSPLEYQTMIVGPIVISDYCAVGLSSTILVGVTMKEGSWLGSNGVLSYDLDEQQVRYMASNSFKNKDISHLTLKPKLNE